MVTSIIKKAQAKLKMALMGASRGGVKEVTIEAMPTEWESFMGTADKWVGIEMPISENSSACLYRAQKGSIFPPHKHTYSREHMTIMNKSGKMTVYSDNGIDKLSYPQSIALDPNIVHAVEFEEETIIMVVWHPMFQKGWEAVFTDKEEEKNGIRSTKV